MPVHGDRQMTGDIYVLLMIYLRTCMVSYKQLCMQIRRDKPRVFMQAFRIALQCMCLGRYDRHSAITGIWRNI